MAVEDPEFDIIEYINNQFPNEQSLASIDEQIDNVREKIKQHDEEISLAIREQSIIEMDGRDELDKATTIIGELMQRVYDMKSQAKESEKTVNDITCDIKKLDTVKRNLVSAVTMLNNIHILLESVENLKGVYNKNEYRQAASILAGIQDVMKQFSNYKHIPQINHLSSEIDRLCENISDRINLDFKRLFEVPAKHSLSKEDIKLVAEACLVVSLLGNESRENLIEWFLDLQLTEYNALFKDSAIQMSSLNAVDKRYAWLKKHLMAFEEKYGFLFPPPWQMSERMAVKFCGLTKTSLSRVMSNNPSSVKLDALMFAISKTTAFEKLLSIKFAGDTIENNESIAISKGHRFEGIISSCFEPYFNVFIEAQDSVLQKLLEQFIDEHQKISRSSGPSIVFSSSNKLFQQYKESLVQCVQLTNRSTLLQLHELFKKYLKDYAFKVLHLHLKNPNFKLSSDAANKFSAYGAAGLLQNLLRDAVRSKIEVNQVSSVILTADYCLETTQQLEKKLKEKIDPTLASKINLKPEQEMFNDLVNGCMQLLIQVQAKALEQEYQAAQSASESKWLNYNDRVHIYLYNGGGQPSGSMASYGVQSTIVKTRTGDAFPEAPDDWQLTSGIKEELEQASKSYRIVLFDNQHGVNIGQVSLEEVKTRTEAFVKALGVPCTVLVATRKDRFSQPNTGMFHLFEQAFNGGLKVDKSKSYYKAYAGDDDDSKFAFRIGVKFRKSSESSANQ